MKKILMIVVLGTLAMGNDFCTDVSSLAKTVMSARQSGVSVTKAMKIMMKGNEKSAMGELIEEMIINAYSKPKYFGEKMQRTESIEFANLYYVTCKRAK